MSGITRLPLVCFLAFAAGSTMAGPPQKPANAQDKGGSVDRGKYVVEELARCEFCHTPRDEQGQSDEGRRLMGGPLQIRASFPNSWAVTAPRIAGQPPGTDADIIKLLTTGIWKTGRPPNPPMPAFRMSQADAEAVLAYLKSLGR